jgi:hypothetical protein
MDLVNVSMVHVYVMKAILEELVKYNLVYSNALIMDNASKEFVNAMLVIKANFVIKDMLFMDILTKPMIELTVISDGQVIVAKPKIVSTIAMSMVNVKMENVIV